MTEIILRAVRCQTGDVLGCGPYTKRITQDGIAIWTSKTTVHEPRIVSREEYERLISRQTPQKNPPATSRFPGWLNWIYKRTRFQ